MTTVESVIWNLNETKISFICKFSTPETLSKNNIPSTLVKIIFESAPDVEQVFHIKYTQPTTSPTCYLGRRLRDKFSLKCS